MMLKCQEVIFQISNVRGMDLDFASAGALYLHRASIALAGRSS